MSPNRQRWSPGFRIIVCAAPLLLYVASFGPACALCERGRLPVHRLHRAYRPLVWLSWKSRSTPGLPDPIQRYARLWCSESLLFELGAREIYGLADE